MHPETSVPTRHVLPISAVIGPGLAAMAGAYLLTVGIGSTGAPIQAELGASRTVLLIGIGACLLAMVAGAFLGVLALRSPIAIGLPAVAAMLIGLVVIGFTPNLIIFVAGQVLLGLGTGVVWAASALTAWSTGEHKRLATALLAGAGLACLLLGPVVSGVISTAFSWRVGYFAMIPVLLLALVVTVVIGIAVPRKR